MCNDNSVTMINKIKAPFFYFKSISQCYKSIAGEADWVGFLSFAEDDSVPNTSGYSITTLWTQSPHTWDRYCSFLLSDNSRYTSIGYVQLNDTSFCSSVCVCVCVCWTGSLCKNVRSLSPMPSARSPQKVTGLCICHSVLIVGDKLVCI